MDYLPTWKVKNGHIQWEMYVNNPYMDRMRYKMNMFAHLLYPVKFRLNLIRLQNIMAGEPT